MIKELDNIPSVFRELLEDVEERSKNFDETQKEKNRIAVVVSAFDARNVLPKTLKEITELIRESGLGGEIFVVLNNGGGNTIESLDLFSGIEKAEKLRAEIGIDKVIFGKTEKLKEKNENGSTIPRRIKLEKDLARKAKGTVGLVLIDQDQDPDNAGKIRGLRDIYEFLWSQNQKTGYHPRYLLAIDAETRLRRRDPTSGRIGTKHIFGLSHLINLADGGAVMVGARCRLTPYDPEGNPDWQAKVPPLQAVTNMLHGQAGYRWLSGGATLGDFNFLVCAMSAISRKLPGLRVEDTLLTAVAKAMNIETVIDQEVVHTNRCPSSDDSQNAFLQVERWLLGAEGVRKIIGRSFAKKIINDNLVKALAIIFSEAMKGKWKETSYLFAGIGPYLMARRRARNQPDDLINGKATFS